MNITHLGGDTFRIRIETSGVSIAVDVTTAQLYSLVEDGLESLIAHVGELDDCPFCNDDVHDGGDCDLMTMLATMQDEAKRSHR